MYKYARIFCVFLILAFLSPGIFSQEEENDWSAQGRTIPEALRMPEMSEAPRFPKDVVIGELGQGESPDEAYQYARELMSALMTGSTDIPIITDSPTVLTESLLEELAEIEPRSFRLGGGRVEADGSVSFLVRILGQEESIAGELYLFMEGDLDSDESSWTLDDLILEERKSLSEIRDSYKYDFSPYERFF